MAIARSWCGFDKWDIDAGENLLAKIEEGLKTSRFVGVVLSPAMTQADWPTLEWQTQVYDGPAGKKGRILPLLRHRFDPATGLPIEIPFALRILKRYDFSDDARFESEFESLVRRLRGERPPRGGGLAEAAVEPAFVAQDEPTGGEESIVSNLLPVLSLPKNLWSDETKVTNAKAILETVRPTVPFWVSGGRLFSFCSGEAGNNPSKPILTNRLPKQHRVSDWLADPDKTARLIQLLNDGLREHCYRLRIRIASRDKATYFCPVRPGERRHFQWRKGVRPRTLGKLVRTATGESFGVHHAARIRFMWGSRSTATEPTTPCESRRRSLTKATVLCSVVNRSSGRDARARTCRSGIAAGLMARVL